MNAQISNTEQTSVPEEVQSTYNERTKYFKGDKVLAKHHCSDPEMNQTILYFRWLLKDPTLQQIDEITYSALAEKVKRNENIFGGSSKPISFESVK